MNKQYSFQDIVNKLPLVNAGILVSNRGNKATIDKRILLNPYSGMYIVEKNCFDYIKNDKFYLKDMTEKSVKRMQKSLREIVKRFVHHEFEYFVNVLPGITEEKLYKEIYQYKRQCIKKFEARQMDRVYEKRYTQIKYFHIGNPYRLYPLSEEQYHRFALHTYRKMKQPNFNKRFINGVVFGRPNTETYFYKKGSIKQLRIEERYLGLSIGYCSNKRMKLGFLTEDRFYFIDKRYNGKQQHLWKSDRIRNFLFFKPRNQGLKRRSIFQYTHYYGTGSKEKIKQLISTEFNKDTNENY